MTSGLRTGLFRNSEARRAGVTKQRRKGGVPSVSYTADENEGGRIPAIYNGPHKEEDIIVVAMKRAGIPVTRENYIRYNWGEMPEEWGLNWKPSFRRSSRTGSSLKGIGDHRVCCEPPAVGRSLTYGPRSIRQGRSFWSSRATGRDRNSRGANASARQGIQGEMNMGKEQFIEGLKQRNALREEASLLLLDMRQELDRFQREEIDAAYWRFFDAQVRPHTKHLEAKRPNGLSEAQRLKGRYLAIEERLRREIDRKWSEMVKDGTWRQYR
jgi:hypothetical protein